MWETWVRSLGWEVPPGGENGSPLQYCCWDNLIDRGGWWTTVHGVARNQTQLRDLAHKLICHPLTMTSNFSRYFISPLFITALFTIPRTWKQPKCLLAVRWIRKLWYIYTWNITKPLKIMCLNQF